MLEFLIMINVIDVAHKIVSGEKKISYALGRFKVVRYLYSKYSMLTQLLFRLKDYPQNKNSFFQDVEVVEVLKELEENAMFIGIKIPKDVIEEIKEFALNTELTQEDGLANFFYSDVKNGYLEDGRPIPQALATKPLECNAINKIINDPILIEIIKSYLNYYPKKIEAVLKWSFVLNLPNEIRQRMHQTLSYHFDVYGFNFVYVNFYLVKTDINSGAHMMIKKSHNKKTLQMLFGSANHPEDILLDYYGKENILVIEGEEGYGFIQDPSCYHKATVPINGERLMLQIKFA